jgi:hypothetical protein
MLSVIHTPPPEVPAQTRHFFAVQSGSATIATVRLEVTLVAPENEITPGSRPNVRGPYCSHFPPLLSRKWRPLAVLAKRLSRFTMRLNVAWARLTIAGEITFAG